MVKVAYFPHDLDDAAVKRRVEMLRRGGAEVLLAGFRRLADCSSSVTDGAIELGQTEDARLAARVLSVAKAAARIRAAKRAVQGADVILARNLEMLALAALARRLFAPDARLVYECLDIHRLLCSNGVSGFLLRSLESRLWRHTSAILTSSPAFTRAYFRPRGYRRSILLAENKILDTAVAPRRPAGGKKPGPPWRIGYFGRLRCKRSIEILASVAAAMKGQIEIIIRGMPSPAIFPDFAQDVSRMRHVTYHGPYAGTAALADAYADVHFAWAIDYYEAGQNSAWLLPNRLYESLYFGSVPIAQREVEIGRWLIAHEAGVLLAGEAHQALLAFFSTLTAGRYASLCAQADRVATEDIAFDSVDCKNFVEKLAVY